ARVHDRTPDTSSPTGLARAAPRARTGLGARSAPCRRTALTKPCFRQASFSLESAHAPICATQQRTASARAKYVPPRPGGALAMRSSGGGPRKLRFVVVRARRRVPRPFVVARLPCTAGIDDVGNLVFLEILGVCEDDQLAEQ